MIFAANSDVSSTSGSGVEITEEAPLNAGGSVDAREVASGVDGVGVVAPGSAEGSVDEREVVPGGDGIGVVAP